MIAQFISSQISSMTGFSVHMGELKPRVWFDILVKDLKLSSGSSSNQMTFERVKFKINPFALFIGRVSVGIEAENQKDSLDLGISLGLLDIIKGNVTLPKFVTLKANDFKLDAPMKFLIQSLGERYDASPDPQQKLVAPILMKMNITGKLSGKADLSFNSSDVSQSNGVIDLKLIDAALNFTDPNIKGLSQKFSKAVIRAQIDNGSFVFDQNSGLKSDELDIGMKGKVKLRQNISDSNLELAFSLKLDKALKDNYGFLTTGFFGATQMGEVTWDIRGTLRNPNISTM